MKFDFGEVLARAGRITWKYKSLWWAGVVISLIGFLSIPINLALNPGFSLMADPAQMEKQLPLFFLVDGLIILLSILSIPVYAFAIAVPSVATVRAEQGAEKISFGEAVRGVLPYFWRVLGLFLLITVGIFVVMAVLMGCVGALAVLTLGFGMVCMIPVLLLFIPVGILLYAFMEQAIAAVIVDNLGVTSAMQRAWELVKQNLLAMALMSLIIYLGSMIVGMIVSVPAMIPMFGFIGTVLSSPTTEPDPQVIQTMTRSMLWWMLAFSPVYAILQGILLTFMQSAWTLTYMRLTQPQEKAPVLLEANA